MYVQVLYYRSFLVSLNIIVCYLYNIPMIPALMQNQFQELSFVVNYVYNSKRK